MGRLRPEHVRLALEVMLVAALGLQAARLAWVVLAPAAPLTAVGVPGSSGPRADLGILTRFNPFEGVYGPAPATPSASIEGLTLHGLRTGGLLPASAIIGVSGGLQRAFKVGDEIAPGLVLDSVGADHIILLRAGEPVQLALMRASASTAPVANTTALAPAATLTPTAPAAPLVLDPARFKAEAALSPRVVNGEVAGYTIVSRGGGALQQLGIATGDVLLAVNGARVTPEVYGRLGDELSQPTVQLTILRGSETRTLSFQTGR